MKRLINQSVTVYSCFLARRLPQSDLYQPDEGDLSAALSDPWPADWPALPRHE